MEKVSKLQTVIIAVLLLWFVIAMYLQQNIGLADNGDFTRSMGWISTGPIGIEPNWPAAGTVEWLKRFNNYWLPLWKLDWNLQRPTTSAFLLWLPGALLNYLVYSQSVLYLPILALFPKLILFGVLLLIFNWIKLSRKYASFLLFSIGVPIVLIFTNTEYIAYFNSFYLESASFVFLFLLLASILLLKYRSSFIYLFSSLTSILLIGTAKPANLYWPLLAVPFVLYVWSIKKVIRVNTLIVTNLTLISLLTFTSVFATSAGTNQVNPYNSLFVGVLKFSNNPPMQLQNLGMADATKCIGYTAFTPVGLTCLTEFRDQISYRNIVLVISREPIVLFRILGFVFENMQDISVDYLGKYAFNDPRSKTTPPIILSAEKQRFWATTADSPLLNLWASLKFKIFPVGYGLPVALIGFLLWFFWKIKGNGIQQDLALTGLVCTVACFADMFIVVLGDGIVELVRHLFLSNLLFDIAALSFVNSLFLAWMDTRRIISIAGAYKLLIERLVKISMIFLRPLSSESIVKTYCWWNGQPSPRFFESTTSVDI